VGLLVAAIAVVILLVLDVRPNKFPPTDETNQWAAEAAVIGGGALFLAIVATAIAVVAYINSTEKPSLELRAAYSGSNQPLLIHWNNSPPGATGMVTSSGEQPEWSLHLWLDNVGPIAARFVAIEVTFAPEVHLETKDRQPGYLRPWVAPIEPFTMTSQIRWEGGADAVVHPGPGWLYPVPPLGPAYLILIGPQSQTEFRFTVNVVADDVDAFQQSYTIKVPLAR